jgi:predicted nucleic acid-binding protein
LGLEALRSFLRRNPRVALDTNVFIYHIEANPLYLPLTDVIFSALERAVLSGVTSTITMTELLVPAYRSNNEEMVDEFYALLSRYPNLEWIAPTLAIADLAAEFRARYRLRTPDALQAATAVRERATGFLTNDPAFTRVTNLETLILDRILP